MRNHPALLAFFVCASTLDVQASPSAEAILSTPLRPSHFRVQRAGAKSFVLLWEDIDGQWMSWRCESRRGRFHCEPASATSAMKMVDGTEDTYVRTAGAEEGGHFSVRVDSGTKSIGGVLTDAAGRVLWREDERLVENEASLEALRQVDGGGWTLIWRGPNGGTADWRAQEIDPDGERLEPTGGVLLREAASEKESAAAAVGRRGQVGLAWQENEAAGDKIHLWQWSRERLQAPPLETDWPAPGCEEIVGLVAQGNNSWTILWAKSGAHWSLFATPTGDSAK